MKRCSKAAVLLLGMMVSSAAGTADLLPQDYVVKEGSGLTNLVLGMTADEAVHAMGEPDQDLYGFIFVYKQPEGTMLSYRINEDRVVAINLKGDAKSKYITVGGAKLGMLRSKVILLYGVPDGEAVNKVFYRSQGIGFFFDNESLYEITITPPNSAASLRR